MNSALVVIDVQESFRRLGDWDQVSEPDIVGQVNRRGGGPPLWSGARACRRSVVGSGGQLPSLEDAMSGMPSIAVRTVNLDCPDAGVMARFYGGLLGWEPTYVEPDWVLMRDPGGGTGLSFQATGAYQRPTWPEEPGQQQKMIHLDLRVTPPGSEADEGYSDEEGQTALEQAVRLALSVGGTLAEPQGRADLRVVLDPAGHPLCLFLH